jgi:hypothetical protein
MRTQEILNSENTKTEKIRLLLELGLSRREVAEIMSVGYGFVQNVFAKTYPDRIRSRVVVLQQVNSGFDFDFDRTFGVEIEALGVEKYELASALRRAGIQIEIEGYNHGTRPHWKLVSDSSIRGENTFELVSPILKGQQGLNELQKVCKVLKQKNAKINSSCGLHIHFDANDFDLNNWKNIYRNYITFEPIIDSFMPKSRQGNNNQYCKSLRNGNTETKIKNADSLEKLQNAMTNRSRYYKLNTESYWRHKTVEFRQHSGTIEFGKISNWILFLARFTEYSKNNIANNSTFEGMNEFLNQDLINYFKNRINKFAA